MDQEGGTLCPPHSVEKKLRMSVHRVVIRTLKLNLGNREDPCHPMAHMVPALGGYTVTVPR